MLLQLGAFGVPLSAAWAWGRDGEAIRNHGWLQGFSGVTFLVIALQVFGGLVTGMVVKYCDNVLKNFALAISVILTVLVAIPLFGQVSPFCCASVDPEITPEFPRFSGRCIKSGRFKSIGIQRLCVPGHYHSRMVLLPCLSCYPISGCFHLCW